MFLSSDGGSTWEPLPGPDLGFDAVEAMPTMGRLISQAGGAARSTLEILDIHAGAWKRAFVGTESAEILNMAFTDATHGVFLLDRLNGRPATVFATDDGGEHWRALAMRV
jgi:photosystem II stability/assembly factor-like uncharacterized protein